MAIDQQPVAQQSPATTPHQHRLKPNAIGLIGVLFLSVATAAPITAMVGNVPIAVGFGAGAAAPAGFIVATVVLSLFALGYAAMAKHITATGAFYGFVSQGLGRTPGLVAGLLTTLAYVVFEAALVGIFGYYASGLFSDLLDLKVSWIFFAALMLVLNALLTYFDINLTTKVLGVFLVTEIIMLTALAVSVVVHGGGPEGWSWGSLNPLNAFTGVSGSTKNPITGKVVVAAGSAGIGLFFAFWSWVGFESSAMYGEESKNPKKIVPLAIMISVLGIGIFYTFVSWLAIVGTGPTKAVALAQDGATAPQIFFGPVEQNIGHWAVIVFQILLCTGSFACGMAFHNSASRYIYAIGRENIVPGSARTVGRTHPKHLSPHIASFVQSGIAAAITLFFAVSGRDPYLSLYTLMAILGTGAILIVQAMAAFSVIGYFHVRKQHPETKHLFTTLIAPGLGGIGMVAVTLLLLQNAGFAAGTASGDPVFLSIPWIIGGIAVIAIVIARVTKARSPKVYESIGQISFVDEAQ